MSDTAISRHPARGCAMTRSAAQPIFAADDARPDCCTPPWRSRPSPRGASPSLDTTAAQCRARRPAGAHPRDYRRREVGRLHHGRRLWLPELPADAVAGHRLSRPADRAGRCRHARSGRSRRPRWSKPTYAAEPFSVTLDAQGTETVNQADTPLNNFIPRDRSRAMPTRLLRQAPVKVDAAFNCPPQHQNPIELIATVAEWHGGKLTIHEGTQNAEADPPRPGDGAWDSRRSRWR